MLSQLALAERVYLPYCHYTSSRSDRQETQCLPGKREDQHKHSQQHKYEAASADAE